MRIGLPDYERTKLELDGAAAVDAMLDGALFQLARRQKRSCLHGLLHGVCGVIARELGLDVVAEDVETRAELCLRPVSVAAIEAGCPLALDFCTSHPPGVGTHGQG